MAIKSYSNDCEAIKSYSNPCQRFKAELDERALCEWLGSSEAEPTTKEATDLLKATPALNLPEHMRAMNNEFELQTKKPD